MNRFITILATLLVSIILTISTFPLGGFSPEWTQLFLIYLIVALPMSVGLFTSWLVGLLIDVVLGSTLGVNALMYTITSYLIFKVHHIIRYITVFQQSLIISIILLIKVTLILWIDALLSLDNYTFSLYWTCLTSSILWPFIFYFLRMIRRKYDISE